MARYPGTERPVNKAGWLPAQAVRARRCRANGALAIADHRGFICEVRPGHVRVRFGGGPGALWLASDAVVAESDLDDAALESLRATYAALSGLRLEEEDGGVLVIFSEGFGAEALTEVRELLGDRIEDLRIEAFGVHELAVRLRLATPDR